MPFFSFFFGFGFVFSSPEPKAPGSVYVRRKGGGFVFSSPEPKAPGSVYVRRKGGWGSDCDLIVICLHSSTLSVHLSIIS